MNPDNQYFLTFALLNDEKLNAIQKKLWTKLWEAPQNFSSDEWQLLTAIKNEISKRN